jgi:hypothetical protein
MMPVDIMARRLEDQQSEDRVYDGRTMGSSHRITRFYCGTINLGKEFRILAAELHERFWDQQGISLEGGPYPISQNLEEQLFI